MKKYMGVWSLGFKNDMSMITVFPIRVNVDDRDGQKKSRLHLGLVREAQQGETSWAAKIGP